MSGKNFSGRALRAASCLGTQIFLATPLASGGQAVSSTSRLREPTLCVQSCLLLESEASAELGEAEISDDAECFGGIHGRLQDTQRLSDRQPMQATKQ